LAALLEINTQTAAMSIQPKFFMRVKMSAVEKADILRLLEHAR